MVLFFLGTMGACVGSFLNVVAWRLPRECMSIVRPRSRCTQCSTWISWWDNLPIISWLILRGRCRKCRTRISCRYFFVELATAVWFAGSTKLLFGDAPLLHSSASQSVVWLHYGVVALIFCVLLVLALIDWDYRILPDQLTIGGMIVGPLLAFAAPDVQHGRMLLHLAGDGAWALRTDAALNGLLGMILGAGVLWLVGVIGTRIWKRDAMGFGDVKMIGAMGAVLGLWVFLALVVASVTGALAGLVRLAIRKDHQIPFGPFLGLGMLVVVVAGPQVLDLWLGLARV
ncbi:MAG: prepilin peptidase [Planctomycetes bacterium]|nr:prepilin peptidase [Planctomycetota bacterium]